MIIVDAIQGSPEWHRARYGVVTASALGKIITPGKLELSKQRHDYMRRLLHEWVTQSSAEEFRGNRWTEHGHECEGEAVDYFGMVTGLELRAVGFIYRDSSRATGCSPDALDAASEPTFGLELKCPAGWTHIGWLMTGEQVPPEHVPQVQFALWVTGLPRWYWMSYAAPLPDEPWAPDAYLPPIVVECEPDPRWQAAFDEHVPTFIAEMLTARELLVAERGVVVGGKG